MTKHQPSLQPLSAEEIAAVSGGEAGNGSGIYEAGNGSGLYLRRENEGGTGGKKRYSINENEGGTGLY